MSIFVNQNMLLCKICMTFAEVSLGKDQDRSLSSFL